MTVSRVYQPAILKSKLVSQCCYMYAIASNFFFLSDIHNWFCIHRHASKCISCWGEWREIDLQETLATLALQTPSSFLGWQVVTCSEVRFNGGIMDDNGRFIPLTYGIFLDLGHLGLKTRVLYHFESDLHRFWKPHEFFFSAASGRWKQFSTHPTWRSQAELTSQSVTSLPFLFTSGLFSRQRSQ